MMAPWITARRLRDYSDDLWALQDYSDDTSWTRRLRVNMPWPSSWVMNAGVVGQNVILLKGGSVPVLYDLTEKKVLKQISFANCPNNTVGTRPTAFVFRDRVERHAFFALNKTPISPFTLVYINSAYKYGS